ncbi:MAG TPA: nucleoid-associated protein [Candidatus Acidoferrum sp.]|jgi:hypothetical protein|nr:nucleoid-associated protein [Candidatus Acidoferrum sp.]
MKNDLGLLVVKSVIFHEVPHRTRKETGSGPVLSEVESPITPEIKVYLRDRVNRSVGSSRSFDIEFDPQSSSPVPGLIRSYTAHPSPTDFVRISQEMATHLYTIQTGSNPAGLLALVDCELGSSPAVALLKIEKEEGARLQQDTLKGKKTFNVLHFRDLILTENTRLFKIASFIRMGEDFDAAASDHQRGYTPHTEVADFFLRKFLGCKLLEEAHVATKKFYEYAMDFLNTNLKDDPLRLVKCVNHLVSELSSEQGRIDPRKFAEKYLPLKQRQKFLTHLEENGLSTKSFPLETTLIEPRLRHQLLEFRSGIKVVTPTEGSEEHIKLEKLESGEVRAEIRDFLDNVSGK